MKSSSQLHLPLSHEEVNIADMSLEDVIQCFPLIGEAKRVGLGIANKKQIQIYLYSKETPFWLLYSGRKNWQDDESRIIKISP